MIQNTEDEETTIRHISFYSALIETIGYNPLYAILEIRLTADGKIRRYSCVSEDVWYRLRDSIHPDTYFRRHICGRYAEVIVLEEEHT